jgi:hypothetical protein
MFHCFFCIYGRLTTFQQIFASLGPRFFEKEQPSETTLQSANTIIRGSTHPHRHYLFAKGILGRKNIVWALFILKR